MSDSVDRVFVHALNTVKRIPRTGSARPPPTARLQLYGLYKQSMEGDVEGVMKRPEGSNPDEEAEREKWDAWSSNHSLSRTEAKRRYISTLIETMHKYASTTSEARELVAELEFVWDQIKSNSVTSSTSSPGQQTRPSAQPEQQQGMSYASLGPEQSRQRERESRVLRVLRPISDGDEEEIEGEEFEEARSGLTDDEEGEDRVAREKLPKSTDLDVRNRKWRKRVEQAIIRMTAEVAALREQLEAKGVFEGRPRRRVWAWMVWIAWATIKHVLVDAAVLAFLYLWFKRKDDQRLEIGLRLLAQAAAKRSQRIPLPKRLKAMANG